MRLEECSSPLADKPHDAALSRDHLSPAVSATAWVGRTVRTGQRALPDDVLSTERTVGTRPGLLRKLRRISVIPAAYGVG